MQQQQNNPELFAYSGTGTSNRESLELYTPWFEEMVNEVLGNDYRPSDYDPDVAPRLDVMAPYPEAACVRNLSLDDEVVQGSAIVGIVVDPAGYPLEDSEPVLLQSSGYAFLNQLALDLAKEQEFEPRARTLAYQVRVTFSPEGAAQCAERIGDL